MKRVREKCLECEGDIPKSSRMDSKFCCGSCKARYWRKSRGSEQSLNGNITILPKVENKATPIKATPLEGLRGVIDNTIKEEKKDMYQKPYEAVQDCIVTDTQEETWEYKKWIAKKMELETEIKREENIMLGFDRDINQLETAKYPHKKSARGGQYFIPSSDMYLLKDILDLEMEEDATIVNEHKFEIKRQADIEELKKQHGQCEKMHGKNMESLKNVKEILSKTAQYAVKPKLRYLIADVFKSTVTKKIPAEQSSITTEESEDTLGETEVKIETNNRIISSKELIKLDYKSLNFQGRWKDFLGQPAVIFHFAIHGLPGGGKSTFCLQLADYLADNFGNVMYVSGEEGYSKTLKDKVILTKADSSNLYFHDAKNLEEIREYVPADQYHFIFIDSLDTLRIDAIKLRELRKHYPNSAFITISQSRKDGKMKGDSEILHDADTIIRVHNGIATLSKNRFGSSADKQFEVFAKSIGSQEKAKTNTIRNVI